MGLTNQSTGRGVQSGELHIQRRSPEDRIVALAGNPNVGKSTVFNGLTGLRQHTGNWPGKTVQSAQGYCRHGGMDYILVDLPGTYSLMANSVEEEVARDFICFGGADAVVVVADATCLERNLNLVLQTLEITQSVVVCVNLMDEAKKKRIRVDLKALSARLGVPVVGTNALSGGGLKELMDRVQTSCRVNIKPAPVAVQYGDAIERALGLIEPRVLKLCGGRLNSRWVSLRLLEGDDALLAAAGRHLGFDIAADGDLFRLVEKARGVAGMEGLAGDAMRDHIVSRIVKEAERIANECVVFEKAGYDKTDRKIDRILTSRMFGIPVMIGLLGLVFWLTITGANYPSQLLANFLFGIENKLTAFVLWLGAPAWVHGLLVQGVYRTLAWVVSVMLPPMAIFFPLFTLLEDLGYLPRVAFNLDAFFKRACAHGKQALTMCMGFGCNAAGIIGCRIIDSKRERMIAMITNNFVPCNGRFPTLIAIITMFFAFSVSGLCQSVLSALLLTAVIVLGIAMTFIVSRILSKTVLKGLPSSFSLELPPYRRPQIGKVIVRSVFDRTLFVLGRAVMVAAPAGLVIWCMANITVGGASVLLHCARFFDPFAKLIGMDGFIWMAFILGFPANEIVVPIIIMCYTATGSMLELESLSALRALLVSNGWTWLTAVCTMLFSLMHWPCGTTLLTIKKESQSAKCTWLSFLVPSVVGIVVCFLVANGARVLGMA